MLLRHVPPPLLSFPPLLLLLLESLLAQRRDDGSGPRGIASRGAAEGLSQRRVDDVPSLSVRVEVLVGASELGAWSLGFGFWGRKKEK